MIRKSGLASAVVLSSPLSTLKDSRHSVWGDLSALVALRHLSQSWASLSVLRAHSPEADLASLRRRTVPRTATEGTAARKFVMLDLTPRRDPGVSTLRQSWASLSVLRAHSPEADLPSLRRRTVPRTTTEGTAARKFVMLDLTPHRDPGVSTSDIPFSLAAYFQSGSDSIARPKMAL